MLTPDENKILTETSRGTPMGELFRRFWLPALLAEELPSRDCPPVRVRLLGEDLVAFRDSEGKPGLLDAHCPHRRADLFYGRNEDRGLRCIYHGWKFDVEGACMDMPSEPAETNFQSKVSTTAYPLREWGGLIWAYLGPKQLMPELPELEWARVPDSHRYVDKYLVSCNYLQAVEGDIDNSHVSFLHSYLNSETARRSRTAALGQLSQYVTRDRAPKVILKDTDYGLMIGWRRDADEQHYYWRITHWLMPGYSIVGAPEAGQTILCNARAPVDDEHSWFFRVEWNPERPLTAEELNEFRHGGVVYAEKIPGTFRPKANRDNDYLIDRQAQRSYNFAGIKGINEQDQAVAESAGVIADRSLERLGTSDTAIIGMRRLLLRAVRDLQEGIEPSPAHHGDAYRVRSCGAVLERDVPFDEGARALMTART